MKNQNGKKERRAEMLDILGEFFHDVIAPYFDREHKEIMQRFDQQDKEIDIIQRKLEKNQEDHDGMFDRLERIEKKVDGHERKIKKLERIVAD